MKSSYNFVFTFRICCLIIWTLAIFYATLSIFHATEEHIPNASNYYLNPGPLSFLLKRGRDATDQEWTFFISIFIEKLFYFYLIYLTITFLTRNLRIEYQMTLSVLVCFFAINSIIGWRSLIFYVQQPLIYCILLKIRSKALIWTSTIFFLYIGNCPWFTSFYINLDGGITEWYFLVFSGWMYARCLSFSFDCWNRSHISFIKLICYVFYFPTFFTGPIVLYSTFERDILERRGTKGSYFKLLKDVIRVLCIGLISEFVLHLLYFRKLSLMNPIFLKKLNLWTLGGSIFWLGQFFMLKYQFFYGIATALGNFEGLQMPPLPKCPSHIHRYSVLWKDFDRGLYDFLLKYIYIPSIKYLAKIKLPMDELRKFLASLLTFAYIFVWHGFYYDCFIWAVVNFIGITIERLGSRIKLFIDSKIRLSFLVWDFIIEPIVTVPLAALSILNSAIFTCNLMSAKVFTQRLLIEWQNNYTLLILYAFTHVAVGWRTWPNRLKLIKDKKSK